MFVVSGSIHVFCCVSQPHAQNVNHYISRCLFATFKPKKAKAFQSKRLFQVFVLKVVLQFTSQCQKVHEYIKYSIY